MAQTTGASSFTIRNVARVDTLPSYDPHNRSIGQGIFCDIDPRAADGSMLEQLGLLIRSVFFSR